MDCCPCCLDRNHHRRARDEYVQLAHAETCAAKREVHRLRSLYGDVCWYNFEVSCSRWQPPWVQSDPQSLVQLCTLQETHRWKDGDRYVSAQFLPWYRGAVRDAPKLPPPVIGVEIKSAQVAYEAALLAERAAIDYAPPYGVKYLELCSTTHVPNAKKRALIF
jgi:hypothetical protein